MTRLMKPNVEAISSKKTSHAKILSSLPPAPVESDPTIEETLKQINIGSGKTSKATTQISLYQLLTQAISSSDSELFEKALSTSDSKHIASTIARLAAPQIMPLLDALTTRLVQKPSRGPQLIQWIRSVLLQHAAYLTSVPGLSKRLSQLHNILTQRQQTLQKLDKLNGRLEVLQFCSAPTEDADEDLVVFDDADDLESDSDEEMEEDAEDEDENMGMSDLEYE